MAVKKFFFFLKRESLEDVVGTRRPIYSIFINGRSIISLEGDSPPCLINTTLLTQTPSSKPRIPDEYE